MLLSIGIFYGVMILYHSINILTLHQIGYTYISTISILRDLWWIVIVFCAAWYHYKQLLPFCKKRSYVMIGIATTFLLGIIVSKTQWTSRYNILVGIKYGFMFLWIMLSALFIGHTISKKIIDTIQKRLPKILLWIMVVWLLRQWAKYIRPDFFMHIWYGPIWNFIFGQEPPIYYRTWPWWRPRLQGLFAWPNNYGYFLAAIFPFLLMQDKQEHNNNTQKNWFITIIVATISIIMTLSRTAIIWSIVGVCFVYRQQIKKYKKTMRTTIWIIIAWMIALSILKWWSTQEHLTRTRSSIQYVIQKPLWYGLGTAGPAIHHEGMILPENYYLQIAIDTWLLWIIVLVATCIALIWTLKKINNNKSNTQKDGWIIWLYILCIMWLFLHVFEDSMVNYLFFVPRGIFIGYYNRDGSKNRPTMKIEMRS